MPGFTVVIPTYNRRASLMRTLDALGRQTLPPDRFEVVVVSDGSPDDTVAAVRSRSDPYRLRILEQENAGPSVARNYGARAACAEVIVYLDDDIEPVPGFLEEHGRHHAADDRIVVIGPQSMPVGERFPAWIAWEHRMLERQYERFRSGEWQAGPNNLYSGNFSVRRSHLLEAGGFDVGFKRQEDVELGFRLAAMGLRFVFEPRADGIHRPERTYNAWYTTPYLYGVRDVQMARDKGQAAVLALARKHYRQRNRLTRMAARICVGRSFVEPVAFGLLKPTIPLADRAGLRRVSLVICSLVFNLRYLQGMAQEMGGAGAMWQAITGPAPRPEEVT